MATITRRLVAQLADAARSDRADRGSNPREPTIRAEGRDGDLGGLISLEMRVRFPPPRPTAGSFNGRTAVLQTAHGGSIPSPATSTHPCPNGGRRQTVRRGSVKPVLVGSTPIAHPNFFRRRVVGELVA